jgi:osmotically-inducible protein OsmY
MRPGGVPGNGRTAHEIQQFVSRASAALAAAVVLIGLAGCNRETPYQTGSSTQRPTTSAMGSAGQNLSAKVDDAKIVTKVKSGLASDKNISALKINVDSRDGVVTLTGSVPNAAAQARAVQIARDTKDVRSVENQLKVAG